MTTSMITGVEATLHSGDDQALFPEEDAAEPPPSLHLEFGDLVPLTLDPLALPVVGLISIGGI